MIENFAPFNKQIRKLEDFFNLENSPILPFKVITIDEEYKQLTYLHSHNFFQIIFIDKGNARQCIESEESVEMKSHSISVVFPKQLHSISFSKDTKAVILMFDEALFCSDILKNELKAYNRNLSDKLNIISSDKINYNQIRKIVQQITFLFTNLTPIRKEQIRFYIKILLLQLIEDVHDEILPSKNLSITNLYVYFKELIDNQYLVNKTVKVYADQMGITTKKLNSVCKSESKTNALEVIHERVLLEAKRMLMFSDTTIKEIAFILGFTSPSTFNRFIFNQTGLTPLKLKQQNILNEDKENTSNKIPFE